MDHKPKNPKECVVCEIAIATFIIIIITFTSLAFLINS